MSAWVTGRGGGGGGGGVEGGGFCVPWLKTTTCTAMRSDLSYNSMKKTYICISTFDFGFSILYASLLSVPDMIQLIVKLNENDGSNREGRNTAFQFNPSASL